MQRIFATLLLLLATGCSTPAPPAPAPRIGVQLWSVKDEIKRDFDATLANLAALGFEGVEFAGEFGRYRSDPAALRALLDRLGLRCAGAHVGLDQLTGARFDSTTAFYLAIGCSELIVPFDARGASLGGAAQLAAELSALSARLAALGMRTGYHNHAVEMAGADGHTVWDALARATPARLILQQDVGWTTFAGKTPAAYVARYPGRSLSLHYKAKLAPGASGKPIIGQDGGDWAGLTRAARSVGGTAWLIVEQEEYPDGMGQLASVAASLRSLQAILAAPAPAP